MSIDNPFGRQPKPVIVILDGELPDIEHWHRELSRCIESNGDSVHRIAIDVFKIYPRAVND